MLAGTLLSLLSAAPVPVILPASQSRLDGRESVHPDSALPALNSHAATALLQPYFDFTCIAPSLSSSPWPRPPPNDDAELSPKLLRLPWPPLKLTVTRSGSPNRPPPSSAPLLPPSTRTVNRQRNQPEISIREPIPPPTAPPPRHSTTATAPLRHPAFPPPIAASPPPLLPTTFRTHNPPSSFLPPTSSETSCSAHLSIPVACFLPSTPPSPMLHRPPPITDLSPNL